MEKLKVRIEKVKNESISTVIVNFTNGVPKESIIDCMNGMFEIEMFTAKINVGKKTTTISLETNNDEKIEIMRKGMIRMFRQTSGLNNLINN